MLDVLAFVLLGVLAGVFTGLAPGIHVNTVASFLLVSSLGLGSLHFSVFVVSMAIAHTFLDFIPSLYLGAPEEGTELSVLPGHKLLLQGRGYEALLLTVTGGVGGILMTIMLLPLMFLLIPGVYASVREHIGLLVLLVALSMVRTDTVKSVFVFLLAGAFGLVVLESTNGLVLLPVLSGLFGVPTLIMSLSAATHVPPQIEEDFAVRKDTALWGTSLGMLAGMVVGILPGIGLSAAASLANELRKDVEGFLVSLGAINTISSLFAIMSLYLISRPRSGAAVVIAEVMDVGFRDVLLFVFVALLSASLSALLALRIGKVFWRWMRMFEYRKLNIGVIALLALLTFLLTGPFGLLLLFTATCIGMLAPLWNLKRSLNMGVLMLPVMLFYFGV